MIPSNIERQHILLAIDEISRMHQHNAHRKSKNFCLVEEGKHYPPKYVISVANKFANGYQWPPTKFSGGNECNTFLRSRCFDIIDCNCGGTQSLIKVHRPHMQRIKPAVSIHTGKRCPKCKTVIHTLLERAFGQCIVNWRPEWAVTPEPYSGTELQEPLRRIFKALESARGRTYFVKTDRFPPCDYYVPSPGFIVELDESQHFTYLRKITFDLYPADIDVQFDIIKWRNLCETIDAHDNYPLYRDEQRAWFDTLRDLVPPLMGMWPTSRLYAGDYMWCSLNPQIAEDIQFIKSKLRSGTMNNWAVQFKTQDDASVARIIIAREWSGELNEAHRLLTAICEQWPIQCRVKYLITCGGFLTFPWPLAPIMSRQLPLVNQTNNLIAAARKYCSGLLDLELRQKLKIITRYITLGVDSMEELDDEKRPHIELVAFIDLEEDKWYWTGKSYPTTSQAKGLVAIADFDTHFLDLHNERLMILGCHDINMFSHRTQAVTEGWRKEMIQRFCHLAKIKAPTRVLHHPHRTDSVKVWSTALSGLFDSLPTIKEYHSAGQWYYIDKETGLPTTQRSPLEKVLGATAIGKKIDIIVK